MPMLVHLSSPELKLCIIVTEIKRSYNLDKIPRVLLIANILNYSCVLMKRRISGAEVVRSQLTSKGEVLTAAGCTERNQT